VFKRAFHKLQESPVTMKNPKDDDSIEDISSSVIDVDNDIQIA
jgi:hypothetical protein